jgi:predicted NUDIX family NTP pyrophosphohydrolase
MDSFIMVLLLWIVRVKRSAGILLYRRGSRGLEVLLVHPGGPFWSKRDAGAWTIPKGEISEGEEPLAAARREFLEETGFEAQGDATALAPLRQKGGKWVHAWAVEGDCDAEAIRSNTFAMQWPPRSGKMAEFPEVDRAAWFTPQEARERILASQTAFIDELEAKL